MPFSSELRIMSKVFEFRNLLFEARDPLIADSFRDEPGKTRIAQHHPSAGSHPIGDVMELLPARSHKNRASLSVSRALCAVGNSVYGMASYGGQMGHSDVLIVRLIDDRKTPYPLFIVRVGTSDLVKKPSVDLKDDLKMTGQHRSKERQGPLFERLGKKGVVRVGKGLLGNRPRKIPVHTALINEDPHKLNDRD